MTVFYIATEEEFPNGLRCMECDCLISPGQAYTSRPDGITSGGYLTEELVCIFCTAQAL